LVSRVVDPVMAETGSSVEGSAGTVLRSAARARLQRPAPAHRWPWAHRPVQDRSPVRARDPGPPGTGPPLPTAPAEEAPEPVSPPPRSGAGIASRWERGGAAPGRR